ncbi:MAG TPA: hypothetical protein VHR55_04965 [Candidatus Limnocylindria bacterium]|nr:hypothetical protein [Candidatus Limnocylindria bacterium]
MNDEQIIEYLRTRHRTHFDPPADALASVMSAIRDAPPRRSLFASVMPIAAAVSIGLVLLVVAIGVVPRIGLVPDASASPDPSVPPTEAVATPPVSPSPTASVRPAQSLVQPGDTATLAATDSHGEWGTIRLERGDELGGYPDAEIPADTFVIEVLVAYEADRMPDPAQFGTPDWTLRPRNAPPERFFVIEPQEFERANGIGLRPAMPLGVWPGAVDIFTTPAEGRIAFAVARRDADLELELVYRLGDEEQVFPLRTPGLPPEAVALATPQPTSPEDIAEAIAMAEALFADPDECANTLDGYSVAFPDAWYTNTAVGDTPACSWFTPEFFEVAASGEAPEGIWISIGLVDGVVGYTSITEIYVNDELVIDGRQAFRVEYNGNATANPDFRGYHYVIPLGENGPTLVAGTSTESADDYLLAKAVLDRMMERFTINR